MTAPRDLAAHLAPGESLLWQGRPDPAAPGPGAPGCLRWVGIGLLAPFAFLLYVVVANWTGTADVRGIIFTMLGVNLFAAGMLIWGLPLLAGKGYRATRYGVIPGHGVILQGVGVTELHRWPLVRGFTPREEPLGERHRRVVFGQASRMMDVGKAKVPVTTDLAFEGLTEAEAEAALAALHEAWPR